ncbi:MAG: hypothetical protein HOO96_33540 [Polyangiaceae bacterium]|nr:hypothetical protein [Polyangiaceae bacterium]
MKRFFFSFALLTGCSSAASPVAPGSDAGPVDAQPLGCYGRADSLVGVALERVAGDNPVDPLGYPSFAVDECAVLYVRAGGDLVRQPLDRDGAPEVVAPAAEKPHRPSASGGLVAFEVEGANGSEVRVWDRKTGTRSTLAGVFHHAGEARVTGDGVVFTGWLAAPADADTDVFQWKRDTGAISMVFGGPGQQRFPDGAAGFFTGTDFSEDPTGAFSLETFRASDVLVYDGASGQVIRRQAPGKQAFPTLDAAHRLVYLDWEFVHPEPKLSAYKIRAGSFDGAPQDDVVVAAIALTQPYVRPVLDDGRLFYADGNALYLRTLGSGADAKQLATGTFFGSVVLGERLVVARTATGNGLELAVVPGR